jgi:hypothetical protein
MRTIEWLLAGGLVAGAGWVLFEAGHAALRAAAGL